MTIRKLAPQPSISPQLIADPHSSLVLAPNCRGALITDSLYCCDLILPGAFLGAHRGFDCMAIHVVGQAQVHRVLSTPAKQRARKCRLDDIKALQRILKTPTKAHRACLLVNLLCRRLGFAAIRNCPAETLAKIVATSPEEIQAARESYEASLATLASSGRMSDPRFLNWQRRLYD